MGGVNSEGEDFAVAPPILVPFADPRIVRLHSGAGLPVWLDTAEVDPGAGTPPGLAAKPPTLRIRASGVQMEMTMTAELHAWVRLTSLH